MARHALLIGVSDFVDKRLSRLNAPTNDVIALREILLDKTRGDFDTVELSLNEDFVGMRENLSQFFRDKAPDDLLLLYYSGHGILGRGNRLYLATTGSNLDAPRDHSISARDIREFIEDCRAGRQIVVLDCCHSGAFAEHAKAAAPPPAVTSDTFSSSDAGLYVLTAADALQFAWDGAELRAGNEAANGFSRFTSWLVDGLKKGEAAPDDEQITMDALYRYLFRRARAEGAASTPQRFVQGGVGDLVISRNPLVSASQIDPETLAALAAEDRLRRLGAVAELTLRMRQEGGPARAARLVLERQLQHERDHVVWTAISTALEKPLPALEPDPPATKPPPAPAPPVESQLSPDPPLFYEAASDASPLPLTAPVWRPIVLGVWALAAATLWLPFAWFFHERQINLFFSHSTPYGPQTSASGALLWMLCAVAIGFWLFREIVRSGGAWERAAMSILLLASLGGAGFLYALGKGAW
jgi:uncharacterized caspase-like protein